MFDVIGSIGKAFSSAVDTIGDIAKVAAPIMFPGATLALTAANIGMDILGDAVKGAGKQMCQELGMPKFLQDIIGKVVDEVIGKNRQPSNPECDRACGNHPSVQETVRDLVQDLIKGMVDAVRDEVKGEGCDKGGKGGGKGGASSWLVALAKALGEVAGDKAAKMVQLSSQLTQLNDEGKGLEKGSKEAEDNARKSTELQSELNGVSKEFQQFQETINTVIKGIGDGLTSVARK